jgi:hypothetical protein
LITSPAPFNVPGFPAGHVEAEEKPTLFLTAGAVIRPSHRRPSSNIQW